MYLVVVAVYVYVCGDVTSLNEEVFNTECISIQQSGVAYIVFHYFRHLQFIERVWGNIVNSTYFYININKNIIPN